MPPRLQPLWQRRHVLSGERLAWTDWKSTRGAHSEMSSRTSDISHRVTAQRICEKDRGPQLARVETPSFFMRLRRVFGRSPKIAAAPFAPLTTPPVVRNTDTMCDRSTSSSVSTPPGDNDALRCTGALPLAGK